MISFIHSHNTAYFSQDFLKVSLEKNVQLEGYLVERIYLRQMCFNGSVNKTILKPRVTAAAGRQYGYVGFSRSSSTYTISEKAIRFWHLDYDPDRAQTSQHLLTCNISSKSMHAFLSNLANRQTDRKTDKYWQKHVPPPLLEVTNSLTAYFYVRTSQLAIAANTTK